MTERMGNTLRRANAAAERLDTPIVRVLARFIMILGGTVGASALTILAFGFRAKVNEYIEATPAVIALSTNATTNAEALKATGEQLKESVRSIADLRIDFNEAQQSITANQREVATIQRYIAALDEWKAGTNRRLNSLERRREPNATP